MTTLLVTKLQCPTLRPRLVNRSRLAERLNQGLHRRLTLISAPAGYGKTTLIGAWLAGGSRPAAWLSLEAGDKDPARFLGYTRFVFYADDSRAIQQGFNDPKTTVPLQQYLAALKYLQTLRSQTKAASTNWLQN